MECMTMMTLSQRPVLLVLYKQLTNIVHRESYNNEQISLQYTTQRACRLSDQKSSQNKCKLKSSREVGKCG